MDKTRPEPLNAVQTMKKDKDNAITSKIIKQEVNSDFYTNIIGERDPYLSLKTLQTVYSQVGQSVVYLIFKELFNYPRIVKPLGYEKKAITIFAEAKATPPICSYGALYNLGQYNTCCSPRLPI